MRKKRPTSSPLQGRETKPRPPPPRQKRITYLRKIRGPLPFRKNTGKGLLPRGGRGFHRRG